MPRVSVIIPTFNRAQQVCDAIHSVLQQTYRDLEIIVCDDCSTDGTVEAVCSIQATTDVPIKIEALPFNMGVSAARNKAIFCAEGEMIAFLDSDDSWKPEKLEKQVDFLDSNPDFVGVGCNIEYVTKRKNFTSHYGPTYNISASQELFQLLCQCYIITSCFLVKKDAVILSGLFDLRLEKSQDRDLWWRIPRFGRIGYLNEPLVYYHVHDNNISSTMNNITGKTYIPAIKRTVWYWRNSLSKKEIFKILSFSHLLVAIDASDKNCYFVSMRHAITAMLYGSYFIPSIKLIIKRTLHLFR